jgi:formylglycine-generating enzyme required for sulfatase activity
VSFTITNNTTLNWNWLTEYELMISPDPNGSVSVPNGWYASGTNLTLTATPSNGYSFAGWTGDITSPSNNLSLTMTHNASVLSPVPEGIGTQHVCVGWAGTGSAPTLGSSNAVSFTITNNTTLNWNWLTEYNFNVTPDPNGTVDVASGWYSAGTNFIITATPNGGFAFTGWTGDIVTNANPLNVALGQAVNLTPTFAPIPVNLTVVSTYGLASPPVGATNYPFNTPLSCSVAGSPVVNGSTQYICTGWSGTGSVPASGAGTSTPGFNITANSGITWNWLTQYRLNGSAGPNGFVTSTNGWHDAGAVTILSATPNGGFMFNGWTGDVPLPNINDNPLTLTMSQARSVQATFISTPPGVTVTITPPNAVLAGAQWRMTSGPDTTWHASGDVISNVPAGGPYTITCNAPPGWTAPQDIAGFTVTNGMLHSFMRTFRIGDMTLVPGGTYQMSLHGGAGGHSVTVSDFYIDRKEVTVGEYQAFSAATATPMPPAPPWGWTNTNLPIVNVSWNMASSYAAWANKRLPTEAEFEYVMRSGAANQLYPWGNAIGPGNANYNNNVGAPTAAGSYGANSYGVFDIAGNVWEWCSDWYQPILTGPVTNPNGPGSGMYKIMRSGSFANSDYNLQCAPRWYTTANIGYVDTGFRCASSIGAGGGADGGAAAGAAAIGEEDANNNGVEDWWEELYFGLSAGGAAEAFDPAADSDSDGLTDGDEFTAGTDPTSASSVLAIDESSPSISGEGFTLKWSSVAGKKYSVERCLNLLDGFEAIATDIIATEPKNTFTDSSAPDGAPAYYRIRVQE